MTRILILFVLFVSVAASLTRSGLTSNNIIAKSSLIGTSTLSQTTPGSCPWQETIAPNEIRFPINMDTHAAYAIYVFRADDRVGLNITGDFPYAAFLSFTTYSENGLLFDALLDKDIVPSSGSVNPFTNGALVNAPNRSYRIMVLPYGVASPATNIKSISMPPLPTGSTSMLTTLVLRTYLAEPGRSRLGGV